MRALLVSVFALLVGCPAPEVPPEQPPLQPVERVADLYWSLGSGLPAGVDVGDLRPTAAFLGAESSPLLDGTDAAFVASLDALALALPDTPLGATVSMLPATTPNELCFDPDSPTADEFLRVRQEALLALADAQLALTHVVVDPATGTPPDNVLCFCTGCSGDGALAPARRLSALWSLLSAGAADGGAEPWMWNRDPQGLQSDALDVFQAELHRETTLLTRVGARASTSPWSPDPPAMADGLRRRVAGDLDLNASHLGPISAMLLDPEDLVDRVRRQRLNGVESWFLGLDDGSHSTEANLDMAHALFLDFGATPDELLGGWIQERWGLDPDSLEGASLRSALAATGSAMNLATHPLGIAVEGADLGVPGAGPIAFVDPGDPAWSDRYNGTQTPLQADILQAHQWVWEGVSKIEGALVDLELATSALPAADATELRRQLDLLLLATTSWARRLDAEFALKLGGAGLGWALDDADALESLAAAADSTPGDTFPVDGATLREAADWIRAQAGAGAPVERAFPIIKNVRYDFVDDRTNVRWRVEPAGTGWSERGSSWPDYPDSSSVGEQDASEWTAWVRQLPANTRFTFRACSVSAGFQVCSADHVLWTPN